MRKLFKLLPLLSLALLLSSCASIVSKSVYPVAINSTPESIDFIIKDNNDNIVAKGKTPSTVKLKASKSIFVGADYTVDFIKNNKKIGTKSISSELDPWYFGNLIFGGVIGLVIDPLTGAMYKLPSNTTFYADGLTPSQTN